MTKILNTGGVSTELNTQYRAETRGMEKRKHIHVSQLLQPSSGHDRSAVMVFERSRVI